MRTFCDTYYDKKRVTHNMLSCLSLSLITGIGEFHAEPVGQERGRLPGGGRSTRHGEARDRDTGHSIVRSGEGAKVLVRTISCDGYKVECWRDYICEGSLLSSIL